MIYVYFFKAENDTIRAMAKYIADMAPCVKMKRLRCDFGTEFIFKVIRILFISNDIKHKLYVPYAAHMNFTAESCQRSLFDMPRRLLMEIFYI